MLLLSSGADERRMIDRTKSFDYRFRQICRWRASCFGKVGHRFTRLERFIDKSAPPGVLHVFWWAADDSQNITSRCYSAEERIAPLWLALLGYSPRLGRPDIGFIPAVRIPELVQSISDATELPHSQYVSTGNAGRLSAKAGVWTGAAAILSEISSITGLFRSCLRYNHY
jgi:hypothetical protein